MGTSFHRGTAGEPGRALIYRDYERWMKEALGMQPFSLKTVTAEGSFTGDPGRYVKKGSRYGHLSL